MEQGFISHQATRLTKTIQESLHPQPLPISSISELKAIDVNGSAQFFEQLGLRIVENGYVKWRDDALMHPRNWPVPRKAFDISLVLLLDLFT